MFSCSAQKEDGDASPLPGLRARAPSGDLSQTGMRTGTVCTSKTSRITTECQGGSPPGHSSRGRRRREKTPALGEAIKQDFLTPLVILIL
jgi:hypothetical protein